MSRRPNQAVVGQDGRSVARTVANGSVWMFGQTIAAKLVSVLGQVVLARWLLRPADFGVISIALTFSVVAGAVQQVGLREILVQRQRHFRRWANSAFWMSLSISVAVCFALILAGPLASRAFAQPALTRMLVVIGVTGILTALATVPSAKLQNEMRFGALAAVALGEGLAVTASCVAFAAAGFGPACVVLSLCFAAALRLPALWMMGRPAVRLAMGLRRWKYLVADSGFIFLSGLGMAVVSQGDYISLGLFRRAEEVGAYYFAFNLSSQLHILLSVSVITVLLSALARFRSDPVRQLRAFLSASRLLAAIGVPACLFQAALAGPIVRLLFGEKWSAAVPALSILSVGVCFRLATGPAHSMIKAQGRFREYCVFYAVYGITFAAAVAPAARAGGPILVAVIASAFMMCVDPLLIYLAIRPVGGTLKHVVSIYAGPLGASVAAVGTVAAVNAFIPPILALDLVRVTLAGILAPVIYLVIIRTCAPQLWNDAIGRIRSMINRGDGRRPDIPRADRPIPSCAPDWRVSPSVLLTNVSAR